MGVWYKQGVVIPPNTSDLNSGLPFGGTSNPFVLYEGNAQLISPNADGKVFKMWFGGANNSYYAESNNGLNWTRHVAAIITGFGSPKVVHFGNTYYLYVWSEPNASTSISLYTSPDGINCTSQGIVLNLGAGAAWDSQQLYYFQPFHFDGTTWTASYAGSASATTGPYNTGLATSTDLINWTKSPSNPVLSPGILGTDIHLIGGTYYAWAQFQDSPPTLDPTDIARSQSTNLINWSAPIITLPRTLPSEGVGSPNGELAAPSLVEVNGQTYQYYTGSPSGNLGVGYQVMCAIAPMTMAQLVQGNEGMAIAFVQSPVPSAFGSATSFSKAFASNNTAGNLLVAMAYANTITQTFNFSDTQGNTWVPLPAQSDGIQTLQFAYVANCKAGPNTVTATLSGGVAAAGAMLQAEYSGVNLLDQNAITSATTGTAIASPSVTTTIASELWIGMVGNQNGGIFTQGFAGSAAGVNVRQNLSAVFSLFDKIVAATATTNSNATGTSGNWVAGIYTFFQGLSISGNAGAAGATVSWSGTSSGSTVADGSGNYSTGAILGNGTYTITPSLAGFTFSPASSVQTVSGVNIPNVNFTATVGANVYSVPDCRVAPFGPNASRLVQGTKIFDVQTSSNPAIAPTDSRASKPVDSRVSANIPQNSRTAGTFGSGE